VKVVDLTQGRDGERQITLEIPTPINTEAFKKDIPGVFKRMFEDVTEIFWVVLTWKLVVYRVPFEGRETPQALRERIEEENGDLAMPPRIIQRIINKGLKQKTTPIIIEIGNKGKVIEIAKEGLIVNGTRHTAEPYRPKPNNATPENKRSEPKKCYNCGGSGHFGKECKKETKETRKCHSCDKTGHLAAQCRTKGKSNPTKGDHQEKKGSFPCHKCKKIGHFRADCPKKSPTNSAGRKRDDRERRPEGKGKGKAPAPTDKEPTRSDWDETRRNHEERKDRRKQGNRTDGWSAGEDGAASW